MTEKTCPDCARLRSDLAAAQEKLRETIAAQSLVLHTYKWQLYAQEQRAEAAEGKLARAMEAIQWALGLGDEFRPRANGEGRYYWRRELARRAGVPLTPAGAPPPAAPEPEHDHQNPYGCPKCVDDYMREQQRILKGDPAPEPPREEPGEGPSVIPIQLDPTLPRNVIEIRGPREVVHMLLLKPKPLLSTISGDDE